VLGIALTHIGVGILLRSVASLLLAAIATILAGAWQMAIAWGIGLGPMMISSMAGPMVIVLIALGVAFGPMGRLRARAAAEELERLRAERAVSLSEIPMEQRLQNLDSLREKGFITEEERAVARAEILRGV